MPRKKHEWYIGTKLHVIARRNHRNHIFRDETDYELYLSYLNEAMEYYKNRYQVIAYVLMTNHVHIVISKLGHASLAKGSDPCENLPGTS